MSYINVPFRTAAELKKIGAPKKIVDYIANHHGYDESHQMIIAKTLGRNAYRLYAAVGNQWMDASLQDFGDEIAKILDASVTGAALGSKTSKAKTIANRAKANLPPKEGKQPRGFPKGQKRKPKGNGAH
jgi:hypothetical protein